MGRFIYRVVIKLRVYKRAGRRSTGRLDSFRSKSPNKRALDGITERNRGAYRCAFLSHFMRRINYQRVTAGVN